MTRTIKIQTLAADGITVKEVSLEEARSLVEQAYRQGNTVVVDKRTGNIIDEVSPETEEIVMVTVLGGG